MKSLERLVLVVTNKCNLHCRFCPVRQSPERLPFDVARQAIGIFLHRSTSPNIQIKFFGGEPLLEFDLIKRIISFAKKKRRRISFSLTTNTTLIDREKVAFFTSNPKLEIWLSPHTKREPTASLSSLPDCGINIQITPENVTTLNEDFISFLGAGFQKFNFLPAYFTSWSEQKINILRSEFYLVGRVIENLWRRGIRCEIKNLAVSSSTPLFNDDLTVDCQGDIFKNNLFLSKRFHHLKDELRIGNTKHPKEIQWEKNIDAANLLKMNFDEKSYESTRKADLALTDFVITLSNSRHGKN